MVGILGTFVHNPNNIVFGVFSACMCMCVSASDCCLLLSHLLFAIQGSGVRIPRRARLCCLLHPPHALIISLLSLISKTLVIVPHPVGPSPVSQPVHGQAALQGVNRTGLRLLQQPRQQAPNGVPQGTGGHCLDAGFDERDGGRIVCDPPRDPGPSGLKKLSAR